MADACYTQSLPDRIALPVRIADVPDAAQNRPLAPVPNTLGLVVTLDGQRIELEASITKLSPNTPYAFGLRSDLPKKEITGPNGLKITTTELTPNAFVPKDLNADLQGLGKMMPFYKNGDYVITLSFRSSKFEWQAGEFLMAALIKCNNGFGFEFQGPSFGKSNLRMT